MVSPRVLSAREAKRRVIRSAQEVYRTLHCCRQPMRRNALARRLFPVPLR
jgi:hypothetical protein